RQRPYDDRWFMYVEDLDLCWRLARAGWRRRLEADISVPHLGNAAGAMAWGDARTERWLRESLDWYARAHGRRAARAWALLNAGGVALRAARAGLARGVARREGAAEELAQLRRLLAIHLRAPAAGGDGPRAAAPARLAGAAIALDLRLAPIRKHLARQPPRRPRAGGEGGRAGHRRPPRARPRSAQRPRSPRPRPLPPLRLPPRLAALLLL